MEKMTVKEIKIIADTLPQERYLELIQLLSRDHRTSVKKIALSLSKKLDDSRKEEQRLQQMFDLEKAFHQQKIELVGGVDEAGRGPLAGPVVAACVIFQDNPLIRGIDDSKKLSEDKREELFERIKETAYSFGIGMATHQEIDEHNIFQATMLAMRRAVAACTKPPQFVIVDGNQRIRQLEYPQKTFVKGDARSVSIASASILAKVTRDHIMREYARIYPEYGFEKHKGYGTKEHLEVIKKYGASEIHRRSFLNNIRVD